MSGRSLALSLLCFLASACSYTTSVKAPEGGELWIEGERAGEVSPEGAEVEVPLTFQAPTWELYLDEDDTVDATGTLARTRLDPLATSSLCACSALSVPACGALGVLCANPAAFALCLAPLGEVFLLSGANALLTTADNASWATVPVVTACTVLGFAPLLLLPLALRVPEEVELPLPEGALSSSSELAPVPLASSTSESDEGEVRY